MVREHRIESIIDEIRETLANDEELTERFNDWLQEEERNMQDATITLRLPPDLLDRIDRLVAVVANHEDYQVTRVSRSLVVRLALLHGVEVLEHDYSRLTVIDFARLIGEKGTTVRRWVVQGKIPSVAVHGRFLIPGKIANQIRRGEFVVDDRDLPLTGPPDQGVMAEMRADLRDGMSKAEIEHKFIDEGHDRNTIRQLLKSL